MALYDDVFGSHAFAADRSAMQPVIDYINANLDEPLPVEELAKVSGLSRAHFSRVFAESEGIAAGRIRAAAAHADARPSS